MYGIKIPLQDFALKMQGGGGLCARGGVFAGHYSSMNTWISYQQHLVSNRLTSFQGLVHIASDQKLETGKAWDEDIHACKLASIYSYLNIFTSTV